MTFKLPQLFDARVNGLVLLLSQYESATTAAEKQIRQAQAFAISCDLFTSIDFTALEETLTELFTGKQGEHLRQAKEVLVDDHLFRTLMAVEAKLMKEAGLDVRARDRILALMNQVRSETIQKIGQLDVATVVSDFSEIGRLTCQSRDELAQVVRDAEQVRLQNKKHTRFVNILGSITILVDAGALFASATTVVFAGLAPAAACAASAVLGGVAQSKKPKEQ